MTSQGINVLIFLKRLHNIKGYCRYTLPPFAGVYCSAAMRKPQIPRNPFHACAEQSF